MKRINTKKFGIATGITAVLTYLGCILFMRFSGKEATVILFNSFLHGLDTSGIVRNSVPIVEFVVGILLTFIWGWFTGVCIAGIYNMRLRKQKQ